MHVQTFFISLLKTLFLATLIRGNILQTIGLFPCKLYEIPEIETYPVKFEK